tara:strand:- start:18 stop:1229 length:1212 start_codon:yes stop_codon:yes gene_type:complete
VETGTYPMTSTVTPVSGTTVLCRPGVTFSFDTTAAAGFTAQSQDFVLLGFPDVVAPNARAGYAFDCSTTPTKSIRLQLGNVAGFAKGMPFAGDIKIDAGHLSSPGGSGGGNLPRLLNFLNCKKGSYLKCQSLDQADGFILLSYATVNDHCIDIDVSGGISCHLNTGHTSAGSFGMLYHPQSSSTVHDSYLTLKAKTLVATSDLATQLFWNSVKGNNPCRSIMAVEIDHVDVIDDSIGPVVAYVASVASGQTEVNVLAEIYLRAKTFVHSSSVGFRTWNAFANGIAPSSSASPVTARINVTVDKYLRKQLNSDANTSYFVYSTIADTNTCESEIIVNGGDWVMEGTNTRETSGTSDSTKHPVRHQFNEVTTNGATIITSSDIYKVSGQITEDDELEYPYIDYDY